MQTTSHTNISEKASPDKIARVVSDLGNPVLIPPLVFLIIGYLEQLTSHEIGWLIGSSGLFFTVLPMITAFILLRNRSAESLDFPDRSSRTALFAPSILSAFMGNVFIMWYFTYPFVRITALVFFLNLLFGFFINLKWKISVHSGALTTGGTCLLLYSLSDISGYLSVATGLLLFFIVLPSVIWARFQLRIHTMPELLGGTALGFLLTLLQVFVWTNL